MEAWIGRIGGVGQIAIPVRDLDRAEGFYRDGLGLEFLFREGGMAFFDCGGVRLMLAVPESREFAHPASIVYYRVDDIGAAFEAMRARGVEFIDEPRAAGEVGDRELWLVFLRDPDGNVLALMSEVARPE